MRLDIFTFVFLFGHDMKMAPVIKSILTISAHSAARHVTSPSPTYATAYVEIADSRTSPAFTCDDDMPAAAPRRRHHFAAADTETLLLPDGLRCSSPAGLLLECINVAHVGRDSAAVSALSLLP